MLYTSIYVNLAIIISYMVPILLAVAFVTIAERKTMASIQRRLGPNAVGVYGTLQPFADALKLFKEYIYPTQANIILFFIGPIITLVSSLLAYAMIPYGPGIAISDFSLGIFYLLAVSSLATYGILWTGWSVKSKYAFLGSLRSTAQLISYELILSSALLVIVFLTASFNLSIKVEVQKCIGLIFLIFLLYMIFFIFLGTRVNRAGFGITDTKPMIAQGFMTEVIPGKFVIYFLAEYTGIILMCIFISIILIGGNELNNLIYYIYLFLVICIYYIFFKCLYFVQENYREKLNKIIVYKIIKIYPYIFNICFTIMLSVLILKCLCQISPMCINTLYNLGFEKTNKYVNIILYETKKKNFFYYLCFGLFQIFLFNIDFMDNYSSFLFRFVLILANMCISSYIISFKKPSLEHIIISSIIVIFFYSIGFSPLMFFIESSYDHILIGCFSIYNLFNLDITNKIFRALFNSLFLQDSSLSFWFEGYLSKFNKNLVNKSNGKFFNKIGIAIVQSIFLISNWSVNSRVLMDGNNLPFMGFSGGTGMSGETGSNMPGGPSGGNNGNIGNIQTSEHEDSENIVQTNQNYFLSLDRTNLERYYLEQNSLNTPILQGNTVQPSFGNIPSNIPISIDNTVQYNYNPINYDLGYGIPTAMGTNTNMYSGNNPINSNLGYGMPPVMNTNTSMYSDNNPINSNLGYGMPPVMNTNTWMYSGNNPTNTNLSYGTPPAIGYAVPPAINPNMPTHLDTSSNMQGERTSLPQLAEPSDPTDNTDLYNSLSNQVLPWLINNKIVGNVYVNDDTYLVYKDSNETSKVITGLDIKYITKEKGHMELTWINPKLKACIIEFKSTEMEEIDDSNLLVSTDNKKNKLLKTPVFIDYGSEQYPDKNESYNLTFLKYHKHDLDQVIISEGLHQRWGISISEKFKASQVYRINSFGDQPFKYRPYHDNDVIHNIIPVLIDLHQNDSLINAPGHRPNFTPLCYKTQAFILGYLQDKNWLLFKQIMLLDNAWRFNRIVWRVIKPEQIINSLREFPPKTKYPMDYDLLSKKKNEDPLNFSNNIGKFIDIKEKPLAPFLIFSFIPQPLEAEILPVVKYDLKAESFKYKLTNDSIEYTTNPRKVIPVKSHIWFPSLSAINNENSHPISYTLNRMPEALNISETKMVKSWWDIPKDYKIKGDISYDLTNNAFYKNTSDMTVNIDADNKKIILMKGLILYDKGQGIVYRDEYVKIPIELNKLRLYKHDTGYIYYVEEKDYIDNINAFNLDLLLINKKPIEQNRFFNYENQVFALQFLQDKEPDIFNKLIIKDNENRIIKIDWSKLSLQELTDAFDRHLSPVDNTDKSKQVKENQGVQANTLQTELSNVTSFGDLTRNPNIRSHLLNTIASTRVQSNLPSLSSNYIPNNVLSTLISSHNGGSIMYDTLIKSNHNTWQESHGLNKRKHSSS